MIKMSKVERYKEMYQRNLITKEQLFKLVDKEILTEEEVRQIIGESEE